MCCLQVIQQPHVAQLERVQQGIKLHEAHKLVGVGLYLSHIDERVLPLEAMGKILLGSLMISNLHDIDS